MFAFAVLWSVLMAYALDAPWWMTILGIPGFYLGKTIRLFVEAWREHKRDERGYAAVTTMLQQSRERASGEIQVTPERPDPL